MGAEQASSRLTCRMRESRYWNRQILPIIAHQIVSVSFIQSATSNSAYCRAERINKSCVPWCRIHLPSLCLSHVSISGSTLRQQSQAAISGNNLKRASHQSELLAAPWTKSRLSSSSIATDFLSPARLSHHRNRFSCTFAINTAQSHLRILIIAFSLPIHQNG